MNEPTEPPCGEYVMNFPLERTGDRETARQAMKRNGCRCIRFESRDGGLLIAHGYLARIQGQNVEAL